MSSGMAVPTWSVMIALSVFLLTPVPNSFGQGLLRSRSEETTKSQNNSTKPSQMDNDSVIPWNSLDEQSAKQIREVVEGKTFLHQMPRQLGHCDAEMYDFMISHPDVVVELWELLGETQISLTETGPNKFLLKEGTSSTSRVEVLYKSKNLCIVYASGEYDAPVLRRKIKGDVILLLKSRYGRDKESRPVVQCDLNAYVRIHNPGAEMLAKILIPVIGKIADGNFEQTVGFVMNISNAAQEDYAPIAGLAQRLKNVRPEVAEQFAFVAEAAFDREVDRFIAQTSTTQESIAELAHPSTQSAIEAPVMPQYARQPDPLIRPQEQTFAANDARLPAPAVASNDLDARLAPLSISEIRGDMPKNQPVPMTTAEAAVQVSESLETTETIAPSQPPRRLTMTNDGRSINRETGNANEQPNSDQQQRANVPLMAPAPAFGEPVRGERIQSERPKETAPSISEMISRDALTRIGTTPSPTLATNNDRVMIRSTIAPLPSQAVSPSPSQQYAPAPGIIGQAPSTQFGTTPSVAPQSSWQPNPPPRDSLPMPMYLP
ncbi:MAG: hypothetical protein FWH27_12765 [Planctomycetaceae bacterium]|nr:hypothetical protein [Planctomycetaceae bacterium]